MSIRNLEKRRFLRFILIVLILTAIPIAYDIIVSYPRFKIYLTNFTEHKAVSMAQHLKTMLQFDRIPTSAINEIPEFDAHARQIMQDFGLYKIKVFSSSGEVTYSSDPDDLLAISQNETVFRIVSDGKPFSAIKAMGALSAEGLYLPIDVVETYVPIMKTDQVVGVFEIYTEVTDDLQNLNRLVTRSRIIMLLLVFIFVGAVILMAKTELRVITENEELHQQLLRSERLSTVGQIAAGIAHEINNILNNIRFCVENFAMRHRDATNMSDEIARFSGIIDDQTRRGGEIASNILSLSQPQKTNMVACDVIEVIDQILEMKKTYLDQSQIKVIKKYSEVAPVYGDIGQLHQLFSNLISNACHALLPTNGGTLTIVVWKANACVEVRIEDTGIGIDENKRMKLFTPFFTTKGAFAKNSDGIPGTGLGLAIVNQIVKNHNGKVSFESNEGKGTVFVVNLPVKEFMGTSEEMSFGPTHSSTGLPPIQHLRVLIIDDEKVFLEECAGLLVASDVKSVETAPSAELAHDILQQKEFDLVFLDLALPGVSGEELLDELERIGSTAKVVILTGKIGLDIDRLLKRPRVLACLQKPFSLDQLLEIL